MIGIGLRQFRNVVGNCSAAVVIAAWQPSRNRASGGWTLPFLRKLGSTAVLASMSSCPQNQGRSKPYAGLEVTRGRRVHRPTRVFEEARKHARIIDGADDHWLFAAANCDFRPH